MVFNEILYTFDTHDVEPSNLTNLNISQSIYVEFYVFKCIMKFIRTPPICRKL